MGAEDTAVLAAWIIRGNGRRVVMVRQNTGLRFGAAVRIFFPAVQQQAIARQYAQEKPYGHDAYKCLF